MNIYLYPVSIAWLSFCFLITLEAGIDSPSADLIGDVSINCGSKETSAASNGREWAGDTHPKIAPSLQIKGSSTISSAISKCSLCDPIPYRNARISRSAFSYMFHTEPGQKFIRLHFSPMAYKGFQRFKDLFTVEVGSFTLLHNFSASLTAVALGMKSFVKEFCVNVEENQQLKMVFSSQSQDTYAFINGIEIKSVPSPHSYLHRVGIGKSTALEVVHREKVKQDSLLPNDGSSDVFGMWESKGKSYQTNNINWKIPVYVGFRYLVRLHFSQPGLEMAETVDVVLKVLGEDMDADIIVERDKNGILGYTDYMVLMKGYKEEKRVLLIYLRSKDKFPVRKWPLMGFEIFKISNHDNSLASPNPMPPEPSLPSWTLKSLFVVLGHRNTIPTVSLTIIVLVCSIVYKLREIWEANKEKEENKSSARAQRFCRRFSLEEMILATRNFSQELLIGRGGFGNVYKGIIGNEEKTVAIKRLKPSSKQGATEFLTEIETLSELKHLNLVSLIGYCNEPGEMILVYEYLSGGTLSDHLHNLATRRNTCSSLTWKQCLGICIGAGRGLDYLHTGCAIIHGDVKASNILVDDNLMAKLSDFGTAKHENGSDSQSEDVTLIKGTPGYFDPYYLSNREQTRKCDIYAFGVVLLEVLCGRPAFDPRVAQDEQILTKWASDKISKGEVDLIVSASLREEISPGSLKSFSEISTRCLNDDPKKRPTMAQVVLQLEWILDHHERPRTFAQNETSVADDMGPNSSNDAKNTSVAAGVSKQAFTFGLNENRQNMSKMAVAEPSSVRTTETHKPLDKSHGKTERPGTQRKTKGGKQDDRAINGKSEIPRFGQWEDEYHTDLWTRGSPGHTGIFIMR